MKKNWHFTRQSALVLLCLVFILTAQMLTIVHFGQQKSGWHIDEMFTYELANLPGGFLSRTEGFMETWQPGSTFHDALSVTEESRFHYSIPYHNQEIDVHPPLYYFVIHTASSLVPNVMSKWIGIVPNLLFSLLSTVVLFLIGLRLTKDKVLALVIAGAWALSVGAATTAVFIRMYAMLTLAALVLVWIHLIALEQVVSSGRLPVKTTLCLLLSTAIGILTQYYFLIFCFFLCGCFFLFLLISRRWKALAYYVAAEFGAIAVSAAFFPKMIYHIFGGTRGTEAFRNLSATGEYAQHLSTVLSVISSDLANGWVKEIVLLLLSALVLYGLNRYLLHLSLECSRDGKAILVRADIRFNGRPVLTIPLEAMVSLGLAVTVLGYILVVSKIAPYQIDRYYMCIYPLIVLLLCSATFWTGKHFFRNHRMWAGVLAALVLLLTAFSHKTQDVGYLYKQMAHRTQALSAYDGYPAIVLTGIWYNNVPDEWLYEYENYSAVFRCQHGDFSGLAKAAERYDLSNGFLLYVPRMPDPSTEELFEQVGAYLNIADRTEVTRAGSFPVYFCTLEDAT